MSGLTLMAFGLGVGFLVVMARHTKGPLDQRILTTLVYFVSFFVLGATFIGLVATFLTTDESVRSQWLIRLAYFLPLSGLCIGALWKLQRRIKARIRHGA